MESPLGLVIFVGALLYLGLGRVLYRMRWPGGMFPRQFDPERERLLRVGRRRVLPAPQSRTEP
jgi:hypothetical protein